MKPIQRRGESFSVGKSKSRNKESRSPQESSWKQNQGGLVRGDQRNYVNCDSYSQDQIQSRQHPESYHGLPQRAKPALTKSTPSLIATDRKPPDLQGPVKVQHPVLSPSKSSPDIKKELGKENQYNQRPSNLNIKDRCRYTSSSFHETSWKVYDEESGQSYIEKPTLSVYTSGDMSVPKKDKKYDRHSLPPHLHRYQADYENISALGTTPLQSEKISEIEDESDESPDNLPPRSPDIMPGGIPMPPIRDPSNLKFVRYSQVHEKYPSWPVTKANGAGKQAEPITARAQSWTDHTNTNKELAVKVDIARPSGLNPLMESSPQAERKVDDGTKRIVSDPGFKTQFVYDKYGRVRRKNYDNVSGKNKFEDFLVSKPGYPPPMLDSDGHNYGDKEYSVPSPPERDMPGVEISELSNKLVSSSDKPSDNVHSNNHVDYIPKEYVQGDARRKSSHEYSLSRVGNKKLDSGTSPMNSPLEEKHTMKHLDKHGESKATFHTVTKQNMQMEAGKQSSLQSPSQGKVYIVKQTPYYNTSTQTDVSSYAVKTSVCLTEPRKCNAEIQVNDFGAQTSPTSPDNQRKSFEEKSVRARMSWQQQQKNSAYETQGLGEGNYFTFSATKDYPAEKATFEGIESIKAKYATDEDLEDKLENASSYIPHYTEYTPSMAPILRKLSEEFYRGRLPSLSEKHISSASSQDGGHNGGLKEAESYSSVVIHPSESSGPFGRDEFGSRSSLSDSRCDVSSVMSENASVSRNSMPRGRHSLDPSFFSHKNRSFADPRYSSASSVCCHEKGKSLSGSEKEGSYKGHDNDSVSHDRRSSHQNSDSSLPSQPKSSSDTRSSGSTQFSDSPHSQMPSRHNQDEIYNDSVFVGDEKPVSVSHPDDPGAKSQTGNTDKFSIGTSVSRKHSMKKAYGIYDESEGEQNPLKGPADQKALALSVDYVQMHQPMSARNDSAPLDQIREEAEVESNHRPVTAPAHSETKSKNQTEKSLQSPKDWHSTRDMWKEDHITRRGSLKRTTSEQVSAAKDNKYTAVERVGINSMTSSHKGTGPDPSKLIRLDNKEGTSGHNCIKSDSLDTKKQQQQALLNFFERKTGKKGMTGSCSSQESDKSAHNSSSNQYEHITPSSPTSSSVNDIINKASENLKNSKAKRSDSLKRSSSSTPSPRSSADYVDMNRQKKVTEWSQLRSQGSFNYSSGPSNRSSFASEHPYEDISVFSPNSPQNSLSEQFVDEARNGLPNSLDSPQSFRHRDLGVGGNMDSGIIVSPTYQNLYQPQRRPPPPLPSEDIPPALPPRNYRKQSAPAATASVNEPGLQARTEECSIDDTKLEFHSLLTQWETHSPREESQYADQLRKQASRRYSEQHRPNAMSMSIIQSRTKINFSTSYKREPMIAQEATQPETTSTTTTTTTTTTSNSLDQSLVAGIKVQNLFLENKNNNTNLESAQKSLQNSKFITESQDKRESTLSEMSLPSPPLSTEELKSDEELPPPPPGIIEHPRESNEDGQIEKFADDSYGAFVSRSRREVGTYKRSVSAATLNSDNNNYKLSTAASSQFGDKPLGKHSWNSDSALSQPGSLLHPYRDSSEGSSLKSSREGLENAPLKSVRESNDEAQLKSELNDGSHLKYTREPTDRSHLRGYRESNDNGSHLKSTRASNDGSQLKVNTELNGGSQLMIGRTSTEGSQLRSSRDFQDSSCLWSSRRFDDISQYRFNNKEVHEGSQLNDGSQGQSRRNSHDSRETKGCGPCEPSGSVPTFKVESSNVRTGVKSSAQVLQSPMAGGIRPNIVYSPRPFVIDKSSPVSKNERTGNKTPCSVKDKIFRLEKESVRTVGSPSGASTNSGSSANHPLDLPNSSEPIRTSSPKLSAGQLSSNSSWKTQENLCSPANSINSDSQRILDSWEEDRQKKKVNPNSERKISSGDASELASAQQRNKDKSAFMSNKTHGQEQLGDQRTSSQCRYSEQSQCTQNLRSDLDSSVSSSDSGIDRTQDLGTEKGQRLFNNHTNQRLNDCSMKQSSGMNYSQREPKNHRAGPDAYSVQGSKDNFSPNRNQVQFMQKSSDYKRNQRDLDNVGIQRSHGQCVDEKNKAKSDNKQTEYQNLTVQNLTQESLTSSHGRQPSQEEIECDLQAQELAKELEEKDKKLSEVLRQDPKRMQYMDGIFPNDIDRKSSGVRRSPNGSNYISEKKTSPESNSTNVLPATYFKSPPKALVEMELRMNEEANKELIGDIQDNDALKKQKEELMEKLYVKLDILKEEKMALEQEIMENEALGKRVKQMVEERCRTDHEKQKFFSFIDDLEKIVRLLLNLAGQLARAENAIQSLPENVDPKIRKMTVDKKERLNSKQEDAKRLKEDIDDRSDQVSAFLKERLLPEQFEDYCYYIKMKSKLTIDFQELEDKLTLGDEQIQELRKSIPDK